MTTRKTKARSRFPSGMTTRKTKRTTTKTKSRFPSGMTTRKTKAG
jgi:hypothetical protein